MQFTVTYRQATEDAVEIRPTKYTANIYNVNLPNSNSIHIGQAIPSSVTQYSTADEAIASFLEDGYVRAFAELTSGILYCTVFDDGSSHCDYQHTGEPSY